MSTRYAFLVMVLLPLDISMTRSSSAREGSVLGRMPCCQSVASRRAVSLGGWRSSTTACSTSLCSLRQNATPGWSLLNLKWWYVLSAGTFLSKYVARNAFHWPHRTCEPGIAVVDDFVEFCRPRTACMEQRKQRHVWGGGGEKPMSGGCVAIATHHTPHAVHRNKPRLVSGHPSCADAAWQDQSTRLVLTLCVRQS